MVENTAKEHRNMSKEYKQKNFHLTSRSFVNSGTENKSLTHLILKSILTLFFTAETTVESFLVFKSNANTQETASDVSKNTAICIC